MAYEMEIWIYKILFFNFFFLRDADCFQVQKKLHISVVMSWQ